MRRDSVVRRPTGAAIARACSWCPSKDMSNPFLTKDGKRTASRSAERTPGGRLEVLIAIDGGEIRGALQDGDGVPMPNRNVHLREDPPRFDCFKIAPRPGRPLPIFADPLRRVLAVCGRTPGRRRFGAALGMSRGCRRQSYSDRRLAGHRAAPPAAKRLKRAVPQQRALRSTGQDAKRDAERSWAFLIAPRLEAPPARRVPKSLL